jgi:hypothetical protein
MSAGTDPDLRAQLLAINRRLELLYQLLYFIGKRLAINEHDFYAFVVQLKKHINQTVQ